MFREVAVRQSFTAAAEALLLSQPAVSLHIRALERELGIRLLERGKGATTLTEAGEAVLATATSVLSALDHLDQAVAEMRGARRGRLVLAANTTGGMYVAPSIIAAFRAAQSEVDLLLQIDSTERILERIEHNIIDLAIVGGPSDPRRYEIWPLCQDRAVLIMPPGHPLLRRRVLRLKDIQADELIVPEVGSRLRILIEAACREASLPFRPRLALNGTEAIKKAVESAVGIALVSAHAVTREVGSGVLTAATIADVPLTRQYELVARKGRYLTPVAASFVDFATVRARGLSLPSFARSRAT